MLEVMVMEIMLIIIGLCLMLYTGLTTEDKFIKVLMYTGFSITLFIIITLEAFSVSFKLGDNISKNGIIIPSGKYTLTIYDYSLTNIQIIIKKE